MRYPRQKLRMAVAVLVFATGIVAGAGSASSAGSSWFTIPEGYYVNDSCTWTMSNTVYGSGTASAATSAHSRSCSDRVGVKLKFKTGNTWIIRPWRYGGSYVRSSSGSYYNASSVMSEHIAKHGDYGWSRIYNM